MTTQPLAFSWICHPRAEAFIQKIFDDCAAANDDIAHLQQELAKHASSRLFDWLDHVVIGSIPETESILNDLGFVSEHASCSYRVFHHPGAQLPRIILRDHDEPVTSIAVIVESIADFLMVRGRTGWIEGTPFGGYRRCLISADNDVSLWVIERRGTLTMEPTYAPSNQQEMYLESREKWQTRPRHLENEEEALERTIHLAEEIVRNLGTDMAAWVVLEVERKYWQARNLAGQLQKGRQDRLGMGWGNHDHHTFRSSRKHFQQLVRLFEILGFHCRERFYAGNEAGWGAQVMENPHAKLVLFLDVDLAPHEIEIDFSHRLLPDLPQLGTIGLWCGLHGDSILQSGMHHLEAQFLFNELSQDLHKIGVGMMEPFSNFPYLKQAFTHGEIWAVNPKRIQRLLSEKKITSEHAEKFLTHGAVGSHLENLQRRDGYKGFNKKNVSHIIKETDPRRL